MNFFEITIPQNVSNVRQTVELDGSLYVLAFRLNTLYNRWTMDIADAENNPISLGLVLTPGPPVNLQVRSRPRMPPGLFLVVDDSGTGLIPDAENEIGGTTKLIYVSNG